MVHSHRIHTKNKQPVINIDQNIITRGTILLKLEASELQKGVFVHEIYEIYGDKFNAKKLNVKVSQVTPIMINLFIMPTVSVNQKSPS